MEWLTFENIGIDSINTYNHKCKCNVVSMYATVNYSLIDLIMRNVSVSEVHKQHTLIKEEHIKFG